MERVRKVAKFLVLAGLGWVLLCVLACGILTHRFGNPGLEPAPEGYSGERLTTADGLALGAWYKKAEGDCAVILLHGDGSSRTAMFGQVAPYESINASLLLVTMRAHGDSEGKLYDFGWSSQQDVIAAVEFLEERGHRNIFLDGASMGATASIFASRQLAKRVRGYILECPYLDLHSAVDSRTHMFLPPGLSSLATWSLELVSPLFLDDYREISPLRRIGDIPESVPILILGGVKDGYVPSEHLELLAQEVASHSKLFMIPEGGHINLYQRAPETYRDLVTTFCELHSQ